MRLTNTLRIAWDVDPHLSVRDVIYVFPAHMTDDEIRNDIATNNAANAIISHELNEVDFEFNNGSDRRGFEVTLPGHIYLDSSLTGGETINLSGGHSNHTFEFKIALGIRPNNGEINTYFNGLIGQNLKLEIETRANLPNGTGIWNDVTHESLILTVDPDHPRFEQLIPGYVRDFEYTGTIQEVTLGPGTYFLQAWGAQGGSQAVNQVGGMGGYSEGFVTFNVPTTVFIVVGGQGGNAAPIGGFNGGGAVTAGSGSTGGGASHISLITGMLNNPTVQDGTLIVAGAGGGARNVAGTGGWGGGLIGGAGGLEGSDASGGGTQTAGGQGVTGGISGSAGQGGNAIQGNRAGGGGGWFGGGGGGTSINPATGAAGGAGGSSFIDRLDDGLTIPGNGVMPNPDGGDMTGRAGNGHIRITRMEPVIPDIEEEFEYTGSVQEWIVPVTGRYLLQAWGASGGNNLAENTGGRGGYSTGYINLTAGEVLHIYVGGRGQTSMSLNAPRRI